MIIELLVVVKPCCHTFVILSKRISEFYRMNQVCCCICRESLGLFEWKSRARVQSRLSRLYSFGKRGGVEECAANKRNVQWEESTFTALHVK